MLKKILLFITLISFMGCNNLNKLNFNKKEDEALLEKINASVSLNGDIIGIGSATISSNGELVAKKKATTDAKQKLKKEIEAETEKIYHSFTSSSDSHTKKILSSSKKDLVAYTTNELSERAIEKDSWVEGDKMYVAYGMSKNVLLMESKNTFSQYIDDMTSKMNLLKLGVMQSQN